MYALHLHASPHVNFNIKRSGWSGYIPRSNTALFHLLLLSRSQSVSECTHKKRDVDGLVPSWVVNPLPALCHTQQINLKATTLSKLSRTSVSLHGHEGSFWQPSLHEQASDDTSLEDRSKKTWRTQAINDINTPLQRQYSDRGVNIWVTSYYPNLINHCSCYNLV